MPDRRGGGSGGRRLAFARRVGNLRFKVGSNPMRERIRVRASHESRCIVRPTWMHADLAEVEMEISGDRLIIEARLPA